MLFQYSYITLECPNKINLNNLLESVSSLVSLYYSNKVMLNVKTNSLDNSSLENQKKIAPMFLSNGLSSIIIIPIELARRYAIDRPSHVTIEDAQNGILIKKLEVKN